LWVKRKKEPFFRWLVCATFPLLINICSDCPISLFVCKKNVNICEVEMLSLGFRVNSRLGGYIFDFTLILVFFVAIMILHELVSPLSFVPFGVGP
jgi:hypothetical protein